MSRYYDRDGLPISLWQWVELIEGGMDYRRVAYTRVGEAIEVSTVWLGLDHNYARIGPPLIFETMVFVVPLDDPTAGAQGSIGERWPTWREALAGHQALVASLLDSLPEAPEVFVNEEQARD